MWLKEEKKEIQNKNNSYLRKNGNMIEINFQSINGKINNYKIKCFDEDIFAKVEEELYMIFPEFRKTNNIFIANGMAVLRFQTIKENKITDGNHILLMIQKEEYSNNKNNKNDEKNINNISQVNDLEKNTMEYLKDNINFNINNNIGNFNNNMMMNNISGGNNNNMMNTWNTGSNNIQKNNNLMNMEMPNLNYMNLSMNNYQ